MGSKKKHQEMQEWRSRREIPDPQICDAANQYAEIYCLLVPK